MDTVESIDEKINLTNFISLAKLYDLIKNYSLITGFAAGIFMKPSQEVFSFFEKNTDAILQDTKGKELYKVYTKELVNNKLAYFNCTKFCELIQTSPSGQFNCNKSCLSHYKTTTQENKVVSYTCHMGLTEIMVAITVGSRHIANVHVGQVCSNQNYELLRSRYKELALELHGVSFNELKQEYVKLHSFNKEIEDHSKVHLVNVTNLISEIATSQLTLQVIHDIGREISTTLKKHDALQVFLNHTKRLIEYDTGCIWLLSMGDNYYLTPASASFLPSEWDAEEQKEFYEKRLYAGEGLVGNVLKDRKEIICNNKDEINRVFPGADKRKKLKDLKSFLGLPMWVDDNLIGVFEIGSQFENAFPENIVLLMKTIVAHASVAAQRARLTEIYSEIIQGIDFKSHAYKTLCKIAGLVNSKYCSLFLRKKPGAGRAYLFASNGLPKKLAFEDLYGDRPLDEDKAYYEPGTGLTGWILNTGIPLRLDKHASIGDRNNFINNLNNDYEDDNLPSIEWKAIYCENQKLSDYTNNTTDQCANHSWMGIPIISGGEKILGVLRVCERREGDFTEKDQKLLEACASYIGLAISKESAEARNITLMLDIMTALAAAIDAKDPYTEGHSRNVRDISLGIGRRMGLSGSELRDLEMAALLHDIGKIGIPDVILSKPGKYNYAEKISVSAHPTIGYEILKKIDGMEVVSKSVLDHHERFDGEGYPNKKNREEISKLARIISVADTFDAITTKRPYKDAIDIKFAFEEIKKCSGTQFDPSVVKAFMAEYGSLFELILGNDQKKAAITNEKNPLQEEKK